MDHDQNLFSWSKTIPGSSRKPEEASKIEDTKTSNWVKSNVKQDEKSFSPLFESSSSGKLKPKLLKKAGKEGGPATTTRSDDTVPFADKTWNPLSGSGNKTWNNLIRNHLDAVTSIGVKTKTAFAEKRNEIEHSAKDLLEICTKNKPDMVTQDTVSKWHWFRQGLPRSEPDRIASSFTFPSWDMDLKCGKEKSKLKRTSPCPDKLPNNKGRNTRKRKLLENIRNQIPSEDEVTTKLHPPSSEKTQVRTKIPRNFSRKGSKTQARSVQTDSDTELENTMHKKVEIGEKEGARTFIFEPVDTKIEPYLCSSQTSPLPLPNFEHVSAAQEQHRENHLGPTVVPSQVFSLFPFLERVSPPRNWQDVQSPDPGELGDFLVTKLPVSVNMSSEATADHRFVERLDSGTQLPNEKNLFSSSQLMNPMSDYERAPPVRFQPVDRTPYRQDAPNSPAILPDQVFSLFPFSGRETPPREWNDVRSPSHDRFPHLSYFCSAFRRT